MKELKYQERENWVHPSSPAMLFLDSGAHSLLNERVLKRWKNKKKNRRDLEEEKGKSPSEALYAYFDSEEFWAYVDSYADFLKEYGRGIDYYVNIDVIFNPELTWRVQRYLEDEKGLRPVPVVHCHTDLKWLKRYLDTGHDLIGIGGLGQGITAKAFKKWGDTLFNFLCNNRNRLPIVRTHGFAMTSYELMVRYPWWSVDSATWAKVAAFGGIFVPHLDGKEFRFDVPPFIADLSVRNAHDADANTRFAKKRHKDVTGTRHYLNLKPGQKKNVLLWLEELEIDYGECDKEGKVIKEGVINHYGSRGVANMRFFERMCQWLPEYPWPFNPEMTREKLV